LADQPISVPSAGGMQSAFSDYAVGAGGALLIQLSQGILGTGFIGSLLAPVLGASMVKGTRGSMLATMAGFAGLQSLLAGLGGFGGQGSGANEEIM